MTFLRRCHGFLSIRGDGRQSDKTIAENLKNKKNALRRRPAKRTFPSSIIGETKTASVLA
jgi:hypothetical protein